MKRRKFLGSLLALPILAVVGCEGDIDIEDIPEPQRQLNRFKALMEESLAQRSAPRMLTDSDINSITAQAMKMLKQRGVIH